MTIRREAKHSALNKEETKKHFIVGIGASAGGLEAINELFDGLPKGIPFSFVIIQHLSPDYKSLMSELLGKHTDMAVSDAEDGMLVRPEQVYVIPSKKNMTIRNGKLRLIDKNPTSVPNTAIDIFFHSMAEEKGEDSICVILSGTGTDGTKGAKAVKAAGGLVLVQDPATAKFNGMPNSAIAAGLADHILSPGHMAEKIFNYARYGREKANEKPSEIPFSTPDDENLIGDIINIINSSTEHDFSYYKRQTIARRVAKRMAYLSIYNLKDYLSYLENNKDEIPILRKEFLIGVTRFFRDEPAFDIVKNQVLPELIQKKEKPEPLKIWVVACSSGEEAYSLAIIIEEYLREHKMTLEIKIFATDVDADAIEFAAKGKYSKEIESDISKERLERFFVENGTGYTVNQHIRKMVVFANHNIIKDPPFSRLDMVTCRNLLIYMKPVLQKKVLSTFHFSLKKGGYLFLGPSENANDLTGALEDVSKKWNIYRTTKESEKFIFNMPIGNSHDQNNSTVQQLKLRTNKNMLHHKMNEVFCETILEELTAAAVFVDNEYNLLHATGNYKRFIELPDRSFQLNLLKLVTPEISVALSVILRKVTNDNLKVARKKIKTKRGKEIKVLDLIVKPFFPQDDASKQLLLVVFKENEFEKKISVKESEAFDKELHQDQFLDLQLELKETKESLHALMEEMETANEELQSSNEELLSSNEELQSTNEELQSLNEELHTVNAEHQQKIKELVELNDDFNNYFRSTEIGQIFIDKDLLIRKYTPAVAHQINIIEADIGRPISHFSYNLKDQRIVEDIKHVIETSETIEKEVEVTTDNQCYLMRIIPYLRQDNQTDGVVITFVDISVIKNLNNVLSGVLNSSLNGISSFKTIKDKDGKIIDFQWTLANDAFLKMFLKENEGMEGQSLLARLPEMKKAGLFDKYVKVAQTGTILHTQVNLNNKWFEVMGAGIDNGIALTFAEITDKKQADQKMAKAYEDLKEAEERLRKLNNNLEKIVEKRTRELSRSDERFRLVSEATNDAVWDWNLVTNQIWWNDSYSSLFGYNHNEDDNGISSWYERIHEDDRERVINSLQHIINSGEKQWADEYKFRRKDGDYAHVYNRGYVVHNENGTPYRMLGSKVDLTHLKEVEDELRQSNENLRKINHDLDSFIYTASHDLKSPIANLEGLINLLKRLLDGRLKEKERKLLDMIDLSISKFNNTIKGLTEITKVQKDMEKSISKVSFARTLETVKEDIDYMVSESNAEIREDFKVADITYNPSHLKSIFYNFLSNAIKYRSEERPLVINVSTRQSNKYVILSIQDNGLGMSKDQQQKLFSMFKRFHTHVEGTGIGLYIVKRIVENKKGMIQVESEEGKGTTFNIYFDTTQRLTKPKSKQLN